MADCRPLRVIVTECMYLVKPTLDNLSVYLSLLRRRILYSDDDGDMVVLGRKTVLQFTDPKRSSEG